MLIEAAPPFSIARARPEAALVSVVDAVGEESFGAALAHYLHTLCGADHFAAFKLGRDELSPVAACCVQPERTAVTQVSNYFSQGIWRRDPAVYEAQRCLNQAEPTVIHIDLHDQGYTDLRPQQFAGVSDRIVLCARSRHGSFGLSVLRTDPNSQFSETAGQLLSDRAELIAALLGKHAASARPDVAHALTRLADIESCIDDMYKLPRREAEVCSRILYGMSSLGIALDLQISEETVKTYRKRAYLRLHIGSERELLCWYLGCFGRWNHRQGQQQPAAAATLLA